MPEKALMPLQFKTSFVLNLKAFTLVDCDLKHSQTKILKMNSLTDLQKILRRSRFGECTKYQRENIRDLEG